MVAREGRRPRRPQEYRAQGTVPLPDIVQPWASFDIGQPGRDRVLAVRKNIGRTEIRPPTGSVGMGRILAVRKERQTTGASAEPETTPDGWVPLRSPTGREGRRPRRPQE
jgi:hypothetical protein